MEIKMFSVRPPAGRNRRVTKPHRIFNKKILLAMKLTLILLTTALLQVSAHTLAQEVTFSGKSVPIEKVFNVIEQQTGFVFFYNGPVLGSAKPVTIQATRMPLQLFLKQVFESQPLKYIVENNTIVVSRRPVAPQVTITLPEITEEQPPVPVHGIIHGLNGEPLAGATVSIKNMKVSVTTDAKGVFNIPAEAGQTLVITNIGYKPRLVVITTQNQRTLLYITLELSDSKLDEIQIVAYGTTTKRLSTGSVTTIKSEEIARNPVPNVLQALQGRVPGMFIQQNNGQPGGAFTVQIRAQSSLNTSQPLFIIDGVAYPAGTLPMYVAFGSTALNYLRGGNALNYLNPAVIESVDVLKDAEATSIYGSRGAYGVVLITTKKGKAGAPQFNVNANTGITVRGTSPDLLNTQQYLMIRREAFKNDGVTPGVNDKDVNGTWDTTRYTNWQDLLTGNMAATTTVNATYSGGTGNINFLVGGNYNDQNNVQRGKGDVKTGGLNFNLNSTSINRKFYINLSGIYSSTVNTMVPYDFSVDYNTLTAPNAPPLFLPDGKLNWETGSNPAAAINLISKTVTNNTTLNTELKFMPVRGLTLRANIGYTQLYGKELRGQPTSYFNPGNNNGPNTNSVLNIYNVRTWTLDPNVNYAFRPGKKDKLSFTAGATLQDQLSYYNTVNGTNFISDAQLNNPSLGASVTTTYNQTPGRYLGYFGLANYNYNNKYILDVSGRYDGSSKFGADKQFGLFGALGAAWVISEEPWFKKTLSFISFAKLRGSTGTSGGDNIPNYLFLNTYYSASLYQGRQSLAPNSLANPELEWEKNKKSEVGTLVEVLNGAISVEADYFWTRTSNQLVNQPLPSVTGFTYYALNSPAIITTNGVEVQLNTRNIKKKDFLWMTNFNITMPRSKLVALDQINAPGLFNINYIVGKPITGIKLYDYAGVNPQTGNYNFVKAGVKGEYLPIISPVQLDQINDRTQFIDLAPKFYGGINNSFRYKGFSLDIMFTFTNRMGKNFLGSQLYSPGINNTNSVTAALRRWQKPGDITDVPRASQGLQAFLQQGNFVFSTGAYSRATYARLSNVNFSYSLPAAFLKKAHINALNIYVQGQNLLTISKYGDLDPENLGAGLSPLRVFTGGLNITL